MVENGRVSFLARRRARRLSDDARAAMLRAPVADDEVGVLQTMEVGLDPLRVLLFGSGPLIGYGVTTRRDAVDGALAEMLSLHSRRGIVVESRVRLNLPITEAMRSLGGAGTVTFGVAVWAPRFGEELQRATADGGRAAFRTMLREFREETSIPLIVCHLPKPLGFDWRTILRRPRVAALNRMLSEEAGAVPGVTAVEINTYRPSDVTSTLGPAWHRRFAERLLPAVLRAAGVPLRSTEPLSYSA